MKDDGMGSRGGIPQFHRWEREAQQQAFFAWLPKELYQVFGIDWTQLPAEVMGYCIRTIGTSPDAAYLAMAAATAFGAVTSPSLLNMLSNLKALFHTLRFVCGMQHLSDLRRETLWNEFAAKTSATMSRSRQLSWYSAVSTRHYPGYLRRLEAGDYFLMQRYQMPVMPNGFLRHVGSADELNNSSLQRWQPVRDTLVPLFPLLRQTVLLRKYGRLVPPGSAADINRSFLACGIPARRYISRVAPARGNRKDNTARRDDALSPLDQTELGPGAPGSL
ncbi:MAG: hypothetical protein AUH89_01135 [Ktedonobacter sp. 13_1_40CM_4_52_4]|nr:MAG: hypothetical protein AUH89_01135 [Ktedonobacter sp. 13_1_40CM_4_52_4]